MDELDLTAADSEVSILVTTEEMFSRKYYNGAGAITLIFPQD
ncbi:MAG: hypothetical protein SOV73_08515 [Candidatus Faecivivens sp.]|nr:hypothetical protein [Candidatus Faecivivens sp.]